MEFTTLILDASYPRGTLAHITRRHRLTVRTRGSHPRNRGSIPLGATTELSSATHLISSTKLSFVSKDGKPLRDHLGGE